MVTTITSKGQITLPKKIRDMLNLRPGQRVEFIMDSQGNIRMIPLKFSITELKGMVPRPQKAVTLEEMNEAIEKEAAKI